MTTSRPDIQALVFDLDDTLMDTFGTLIPEAHRQACLSMQKAGLDVPLEALVKKRWELIEAHPRAEINALLAEYYGCHEKQVIQAGIDTYFNPDFERLEPFPGVPEMLLNLANDYTLFLLTSGIPAAQQRKVKALNLAPLFKDVLYAPLHQEQAKLHALKSLCKDYDLKPEQLAVIGDRITNEILAGNQLGCFTLWIQQGECLGIVPETPEETPDATTSTILEVPKILAQLKDLHP